MLLRMIAREIVQDTGRAAGFIISAAPVDTLISVVPLVLMFHGSSFPGDKRSPSRGGPPAEAREGDRARFDDRHLAR